VEIPQGVSANRERISERKQSVVKSFQDQLNYTNLHEGVRGIDMFATDGTSSNINCALECNKSFFIVFSTKVYYPYIM